MWSQQHLVTFGYDDDDGIVAKYVWRRVGVTSAGWTDVGQRESCRNSWGLRALLSRIRKASVPGAL